jgi:hypothetical protein
LKMGFLKSIGQTIFGGSSSNQNSSSTSSSNSNSASGNLSFPYLAGSLAGPVNYAGAGGDMIGALLGVPQYANRPATAPAATPPPIQTTPPPLPAPKQYVDLFHDGINGNGKAAKKKGQPTAYWQDTTGAQFDANGQMLRPGLGKTPVPGQPAPAPAPAVTPAATPAATVPQANGTNTGDALTAFANSAGLKFLQDQGNQMINNNQAAKGMLQSGATLKGLQDYANNLNSTYLNDYLNKLMDWSKLGLGAAGVLGGAGSYSDSNSLSSGTSKGSGGSSSKPGILHDLMAGGGSMGAGAGA